jgi:hypothetical protein
VPLTLMRRHVVLHVRNHLPRSLADRGMCGCW